MITRLQPGPVKRIVRPTARSFACGDRSRATTNHREAIIEPNPRRSSRAKSSRTTPGPLSRDVGIRRSSRFWKPVVQSCRSNMGFSRVAAMYITIARAIARPVRIEPKRGRGIRRRRHPGPVQGEVQNGGDHGDRGEDDDASSPLEKNKIESSQHDQPHQFPGRQGRFREHLREPLRRGGTHVAMRRRGQPLRSPTGDRRCFP